MEYDSYESELYKPSKEACKWGMLCHVGALAGYVVPFGNIVAPTVIWMMKRGEDPFIDECGKESLNFQITMTLYIIAAALLTVILVGIPLLIIIPIFGLVCIIKAAIKTSDGEHYRYPLTLRLID